MGRVDLHLHTEYSKDSMSRLADVAARARLAGLTHLAVTDHNTIEGARRMQDVSSLPVIVGEEIMTAEGELIGLFLKEPVPPGMSASDTVRAIRQQGALVYLPHPRDPYRHGLSAAGLAQVRDAVDIIEVFNSRCVRPSSNAEALALSASMRAARSAASDAHTLREIGRSFVEGPDFQDGAGLLRCLAAGRMTQRRSSPSIHLLSRVAAVRHRLGGGRSAS
jgi:predicted metal-dependent phosphoesterase TrpH